MKQLLISSLLSLMFINCTGSRHLSATFKAKLVASLCGQHIVQIEDSSYYQMGANWMEYQNVFAVGNHCDFINAGLKPGDEFECKIVEKAAEENCIVCEAYMETPDLKRNVKVIRKL